MNRERVVWRNMHKRCKYPGHYTRRGITVCDRWSAFDNFIADMGTCPKGFSLDRIDNDRGYSPQNCRWADRKTQQRNTSRNKWLTLEDVTLTVAGWAERAGINRRTLVKRLQLGWPLDVAIATPVERSKASG